MLDNKKFLEIIDSTPLISIDLILEDGDGKILLGKRVYRPAQGYWFVPGGRVMKNETLADAMKRISSTELGFTTDITDTQLQGTYDHIYDDNRFAVEGINTHYVVLAYKLSTIDELAVTTNQQHSEIRWWPKSEILSSREVHQNTKNYFIDI